MKTSDIIWQDKQHQMLLKLIDQIDARIVDENIFERLQEYAENHFSMEEEYMRQLNFPLIDEHIQAHNKFRVELETMIDEFSEYDETFRQVISRILSDWLKGHILDVDKKLEDFILKSDAK